MVLGVVAHRTGGAETYFPRKWGLNASNYFFYPLDKALAGENIDSS